MSHSKWDRRHAAAEPGAPLGMIERLAREHPPGKALDIACGLGRHALLLARRGWKVTALDASPVAIEKLLAAAAARGLAVDARVVDLETGDFAIPSENYDLICDCFYLQRSLITRIQEGIRVGGLAAFALPMHDRTVGVEPMNPDFLVESGELRSWFEDWEILEHKEDREAEGRRRVAQLVARRPFRRLTSI